VKRNTILRKLIKGEEAIAPRRIRASACPRALLLTAQLLAGRARMTSFRIRRSETCRKSDSDLDHAMPVCPRTLVRIVAG
jgi:hypothetical protein